MLLKSLPSALKHIFAARAVQHVQHFENVLGTTLELQIKAPNVLVAQRAEKVLLEEIWRLEKIFSRFVATSELNRLVATQHQAFLLSHELESVLQAALFWQERSKGAFHLGADALGQVWKSVLRTTHQPVERAQARFLRDSQFGKRPRSALTRP